MAAVSKFQVIKGRELGAPWLVGPGLEWAGRQEQVAGLVRELGHLALRAQQALPLPDHVPLGKSLALCLSIC